jgi:anti-anti-sigma factor
MNENKSMHNESEVSDIIILIDCDKEELDLLYKDLQTLGYASITAERLEECSNYLKMKNLSAVVCSQKNDSDYNGIAILDHFAENYPEIERILLTDSELIEASYDTQCSFLHRPWDLTELKYTIERALERSRLIKHNNLLQQKLLKQHVSLAQQQKILNEELTLGEKIHKKILQSPTPSHIPGFKVGTASSSAAHVEGGFFEFLTPAPNTVDFVIGDINETGISSALIASGIKTQFARFSSPGGRSQVMRKERIWEEDIFTPEEILQRVHNELFEQLSVFEYYATLFYARFCLKKRILKFIDCGFTKPLHYIAKEDRIALLRGNSYPLGVNYDSDYRSQSIHFSSGDCFIFYSDGVLEAKNSKGEAFGLERLIACAREHHHLDPDNIAENLAQAVMRFSELDEPDHDLTIVAIAITSESLISDNTPKTAKFKTDLSQLPAVRDFVLRSCMIVPGDTEQLSQQMQLAINEIFCNIVKHGFKAKSIGEIVIQVELESEGIRFDISDQGPPFNPDEIQEPSLAGDRYEGFGWYMVKKLVDEIVYLHKQVDDGWNHLELYKSYILEKPPMEIEHLIDDDTIIIVPKVSSLDAKDVPEFKEKVLDIIMNQNPTGLKNFIIDLKHIDFIDSSGLGSFLSILRHLRDRGGSLRLSGMNKSVRTIFELVSMHKVFETYGTPEEAKNSFKK